MQGTRWGYYGLDNPSTGMTAPEIYEDISEAKNRKAFAISSGSPIRPNGMDSIRGLIMDSGSASTISVWVMPGATAFTRISCFANSRANDSVRPLMANLDVG